MQPPLCLCCTKKIRKDLLPVSSRCCLLHDLKDNVENVKDSDIVDFAKQSNFYESLHDDLMQSWMCVTAYGVPNPGPEDNAQVAINIYDMCCASIGLTTVLKTMWHDGSRMKASQSL